MSCHTGDISETLILIRLNFDFKLRGLWFSDLDQFFLQFAFNYKVLVFWQPDSSLNHNLSLLQQNFFMLNRIYAFSEQQTTLLYFFWTDPSPAPKISLSLRFFIVLTHCRRTASVWYIILNWDFFSIGIIQILDLRHVFEQNFTIVLVA